MKLARKGIIWLAALFALLLGGLTVLADDLDGSSGMDVVIVMDTSGSMQNSKGGGADPEGVAMEAAKLFVDMMESSGSRVGLVPFSDQLGNVVNLTDINSTADKEGVKSAISALSYGGDTDIGQAMQKAMEILNNGGDVGNRKMILFFTDGNIDFSVVHREDGLAEEAAATSRQQADTATADAAAAGIPIYSIGLNADGTLDEELIQKMANDTGGKQYSVTSAGELPNIFNEIFADFVESKIDGRDVTIQSSDQYETVPFTIPNDSVMEANIVMLSSQQLDEVILQDPSGSQVPVDGERLIQSNSDQYTMLKLLSPQAGDWTLLLRGEAGCQVHVNLLFNYKVILQIGVADDQNGGAAITAYFENQGAPLTDDALYAQFTAVARVGRSDGTVTEYPMTYGNGVFSSNVALNPQETVTITAFAESDTMYRESEPVTFTSAALPETITTTPMPTPIVLNGPVVTLTKENIDLNTYFQSSKGNALSYDGGVSLHDPSIAKAQVESGSSILELKGAKKGTANLTITATSPEGVTASQTVAVEVRGFLPNIIPIIILAVVLMALIVLLIVLILVNKGKKLDGYLYWYLQDDSSFGSADETEFPLGFEKKKVLMSMIVTEPSVAFVDLNRILIRGGKNCVMLQSTARQCAVLDAFQNEVKKLRLRDGDSFQIVCQTQEGPCTICCRYEETQPFM